ncbi:MAG: DUF929 family protein [Thermoplasmata archaeon]
MVDWDRVEELKAKGKSWEEIAADPKVGFRPDVSVSQAGPALRRLYYRRKSREDRVPAPASTPRRADPEGDRRWGLARIGYLLVPLVGIWFAIAYVAPSPVGLILPAIPYIALILAVVAFLLAFGLLRTDRRWTKVFRSTLIVGIILGLVFTGLVALTATLSGCPFLPSASSLAAQPGPGWAATPSFVSPWHQDGKPVLYFYGATWCPYCSASSWALYKALTEFQPNFNPNDGSYGIPGLAAGFSSASDVYPQTPEMILANAAVTSPTISFLVSEDTSGIEGNFPGTANCVQQAYVSAYSGSAIPFVVVNGQYVHGGSSLIDPGLLSSYAGSTTGWSQVQQGVLTESGTPWSVVGPQAAWVTAYLVKASGESVAQLAQTYHGPDQWTSGMQSMVNADLSQLG